MGEVKIQNHRKVVKLREHSKLAKFILNFHCPFKKHFNQYAEEFPEIDWHSLFSSTVLHSIAHSMAEKNLPDPFLLQHNHPKFGNIARMGQFVRMGFVPEIPFVLFTRKAKDVTSGFFHDIYKAAKMTDEYYADMIDTCIIR